MYKMILGVAAVAAFANPASAQQSGPWVGIVGGYDSLNVTAEDAGEKAKGSDQGVLYGVAAGYDFNLGKVRLGVEVEASDSSTKTSGADLLFEGDELVVKTGRELYIGARVGMPITRSLSGFVKAGYANARIKSTYSFDDAVSTYGANQGGYRLGAGLELDLGKPFVRLEYRFSNYGDFDDSGLDVKRHQAALTAGIRF